MNRLHMVTVFNFPAVTRNDKNRKYQTNWIERKYLTNLRVIISEVFTETFHLSDFKTTTTWFQNEAVWSSTQEGERSKMELDLRKLEVVQFGLGQKY